MPLIFNTIVEDQQYITAFYALFTLLMSSFVVSRIFHKLPKLSSYVLAGIIAGPYGLKWISLETIESLQYITQFGLGMVAFMIGMDFHRSSIKNLNKIAFITLFQVLTTIGLITVGLYWLGLVSLNVALVLGAIGSATAPGSIIYFIKNKGITKSPLKNLLLPVIALDDAISVLAYALVIGLVVQTGTFNLVSSMGNVVKHLCYSIIIGFNLGLILGYLKNLGESSENYLTYSIAAICAGIGLSYKFHASYIITLIVCGVVFTNLINKEAYFKQEESLQKFNPPIFTLFYSMAGALLPIGNIFKFWAIILCYIIFRIIGKVFGFYVSSKIMKVDKKVAKYIGFASLPQAGVAIGLATSLPEPFRTAVLPIILGAVFIFQIIAPMLVEYAFLKAGNYDPMKAQPYQKLKKHYEFSVGSNYNQTTKRNIFKHSAAIINNKKKNKKDNK